MSYRDLVPFDEDTEVAIKRTTLEGLRDAYIAHELERENPRLLINLLTTWIDDVLKEAGMLETVRQAIQADWEEHKKLRDAERELRVAMSLATSGNFE